MATDTNRTANHRQRAITLIELQKLDQAAREARRALQWDPNDAEAYRPLASALLGGR